MRVKGRGASRTDKYTLVQMALLYFRIHSFAIQTQAPGGSCQAQAYPFEFAHTLSHIRTEL